MPIELIFTILINVIVSVFSITAAFRFSKGHSVLYSPLLQIITFHFIFTLIGAHFFAYDSRFLLHILNKMTIVESQLNYAMQMGIVAPCLVLGAYLVKFILNFEAGREITQYQNCKLISERTSTSNLLLISYLIFFVALVFNFYFTKLNGFPIVNAVINIVAGADSGLATARSNVNYEVGFPGWLVQIVRFIIPSISLVLFLTFSNNRSLFVNYFGRWLLILLSLFLLISNGDRMPLLMYVISIVIALNNVNDNDKRNSLKQLVYVVLFIILFLGVFSFLLGRGTENINIIESIIQTIIDVFFRIFLSQSQTGSYIFQLYGNGQGFSMFDIYIQNFSTYFVDDIKSYSVDLFYLVHGRSGSASHSAFAEAYASFGTLGVILISIFLGALSQYLFIKMIRMNKTILHSVCFSFLGLSISISALGSVTGIMYNGLIAIVFVYLAITSTRNFLKKLRTIHQ